MYIKLDNMLDLCVLYDTFTTKVAKLNNIMFNY